MNTLVSKAKWLRFSLYVMCLYVMNVQKTHVGWLYWVCVAQELLDIPYIYVFKSNISSLQLYSIVAHHIYVIVTYAAIKNLSYAYYHICTYAFYHMYVNIPLQSISKYSSILNKPIWLLQFIIPCVVYSKDIISSNSQVGMYWILFIMYIKTMLVLCICVFIGLIRLMKAYNDLSVVISWRQNDEYEMKKIL